MNMSSVRRFSLLVLTGSLCASLSAQAPAPAPGAAAGAPAGPGAAAGRGGAGGGAGGRGGAPAVVFSTSQLLTLGQWNTTTLANAATAALTDLRTASLSGAKPKDLETKAAALAKAEQALATVRADLFTKIQTSPDKLNAEQATYVKANGGLNRGGNTSPGATQAYSDYTGFTKIWDGKTFTGWDGETDAWSIENDAIHMDTAKKSGQHHVHFTGLPGVSPILKDFDFKVEFKASGGFNGGVQYRARLIQAAHRQDKEPPLVNGVRDLKAAIADPLGKPLPAGITTEAAADAAGLPRGTPTRWQISGYQFDITNNNMGSLYEGQYRGVIVNAGEIVQLAPGGVKFIIGRVADAPVNFAKEHKGLDGEWNQLEIIARGNTLIHMLNGHVITVTTDDDPERRAAQGILSLQCEGGAIWYRNAYLKNL